MPMPTDPGEAGGIRQAVDDSQYAEQTEEQKVVRQQEENAVKKDWDEYKQAWEFDKQARAQYAVDRRYAAGTSDTTWAVTTNLIGSFIDILVSFLYARNPDVSVRKSPRVQMAPEPGMPPPPDPEGRALEDFAKTAEIIISRLWKIGRLKASARRVVRSTLSTGPGWLKAVMIADSPQMPQMTMQLNDLRDNLAQLEKLRQDDSTYAESSPEEQDARISKMQLLITSLTEKMEASIRKYLAIDFSPSQDVQVSLDVASIADYLNANWVADTHYIRQDGAKEQFPRLTAEDCKAATCYYQRNTQDLQPLTDRVDAAGNAASTANADAADTYTTASSTNGVAGAEAGPAFIKVVEKWDKRVGMVKTMIDGVKVWAKEPYLPPYPSSRFYPQFLLEFYDVDGARHPQSLSWRLHKLQDEYARSRSNFRLTRERSIPGILFNRTGLTPEDAAKIERGVHVEMIGLSPTDPSTPIQNLFAEKPIPKVDQRLFDNTPILQDMEKIAGVQEALQSSISQEKTATEAEIQQSGFASRTTADRDQLETVLTDLAQYTCEVALAALNPKDAQRMAGPGAYWPHGMSIDDLMTLVEIDIQAGTTGKPKSAGDREAWAVLMPQIKEAMIQIQQAMVVGNQPLASAMIELLRETMTRLGDDTDIDRFIPQMPPVAAAAPVPGAPGQDGAAPSPGGNSLPPDQPGGAAPNLENPDLQNPTI